MKWSCEEAKAYMRGQLLGLSSSEQEEGAFLLHLEDCYHCAEEWEGRQSVEQGLQRGFAGVVQAMESPRVSVLLALEDEDKKKSSPLVRGPWRVFVWYFLFLSIFFLPVAYLALGVASKVRQKRAIEKVFADLEKIAREKGLEYLKKRAGERKNWIFSRKDPWNHPYSGLKKGREEILLYSFGPNGRDEEGKGDDIWILFRRAKGGMMKTYGPSNWKQKKE